MNCPYCKLTTTREQSKKTWSWYVDETYFNVKGKWCYLYRTINRDGNLVDSRLEREARHGGDHAPERVTTDGHDSYPRAIRETLGQEVTHRCNRYPNNRLEQDHRVLSSDTSPRGSR
jgi:putative transposase